MTVFESTLIKFLHELEDDLRKDIVTVEEIYKHLKESDALLKAVIPYFCPPHDRPTFPSTGSIELGILPYWARNTDKIPYHKDIPHLAIEVIKTLDKLCLIPPPTITDKDYTI